MIELHATLTGWVGDPHKADTVMGQLDRDIVTAVSSHVLEGIHHRLDARIKNPTPYYETQIRVDRVADDEAVVNDTGVVYGPWLEGTSSRNQTTRFKGYHAFREAEAETTTRIDEIVAPHVARAVRTLGG